jgi:hypothetical protein
MQLASERLGTDVRLGSIATETGSPRGVRLYPNSGGITDIPALRVCATSGSSLAAAQAQGKRFDLLQVAELGLFVRIALHRSFHSIIWSAATSMVLGTEMPSALAVFMLMTNSNLVGCMTSRSTGWCL